MTKKKIRYSDFAAADVTPAAAVPAGPAPMPTPAAPAAEVAPRRPAAPLDLARALAAARSREEAAAQRTAAPAGAPVPETVPGPGRPPARPGGVVVGRLTPMNGSVVVQRTTPLRGTTTIVRDAKPDAPPGEAASPSLRERARLRHGTVELLVFRVGSEWFGIELARVEEAIDLPSVRHIPEMPPAMLGVTTVRDCLTAVYAPAAALGLMSGGHSSALVFRRERGRLGIAVDDVDDVHTLDLATLRDAPGIDAADGILLGVLRYRDGLLALVDAESLITACQAVPVMEIA